MRILGNKYVVEEFRRHKNAELAYIVRFVAEWDGYYKTLSAQVNGNGQKLGAKLTDADKFTEQQLGQLYELSKATKGQQ
ncbi:acetate non-utilizing protein 9 [Nowakowskiella sp. JEL0407]|nr:acetate non-utilizing protein 9 [Nowakowskiella sp. JEL0407]